MNPPPADPAADSRSTAAPPVRTACQLAYAALKAPTLTPVGLLVWASVLAAAWGAFEALGWRDCACVISGMSSTGDRADHWPLVKGLLYVLVYFGGVLLAPILAIAAGLLAAMERLAAMRQPGNATTVPVHHGGPNADGRQLFRKTRTYRHCAHMK